jgi:hypothetical protein
MSDKIVGYRELNEYEMGAINDIKSIENRIGNLIKNLRESENFDVDPRWAAIAVTDLQKWFMALVRSIAKPESLLK